MHTDGKHCAASLCSVPPGDAGVRISFANLLHPAPTKTSDFDTLVIAEHAILKNPPEVPIFRLSVSFGNRNLTIT